MKCVRVVRNFAFFLGVALVSPPLLVGCGDDLSNKSIAPEVAPASQAKDSMDFFRQKSQAKKAKH